MKLANKWNDYEILDMANGEKLERWGDVILIRPDPQIIWNEKSFPQKWDKVCARYNRSNNRRWRLEVFQKNSRKLAN